MKTGPPPFDSPPAWDIVVPVKAVYRFFKSVRLALVLILVIIALSCWPPLSRRPGLMRGTSRSIPRRLCGDRFSRNGASVPIPFFPSAVLLFTINLGTCTIARLVTRARAKARRRYGPDLVHVGLLVLISRPAPLRPRHGRRKPGSSPRVRKRASTPRTPSTSNPWRCRNTMTVGRATGSPR